MRQRHSRLAEITAGLASLLILAAAVAGLPALLYAAAGSPIPHDLPTWQQAAAALTHRDNGTLFLDVLRDVGWAAWLAFTLSAAVEGACQARGKNAPRLAGLGTMQHAARSLIAAVVVAFSASAPGLPAVMVPAAVATAAATASVHTPGPASPAVLDAVRIPAAGSTVAVQPDDTLWSIAQHHLGDAARWHELARLNSGRVMPGGTRFADPSVIIPGFVLHLPAGARAGRQVAAGQQAPRPYPAPAAPQAAGAAPATPAPEAPAAPAASVTRLAAPPAAEAPAPVAGAFALGMLSGGLVVTLAGMRHRQRQHRRRGRRIALPASPAARRIEHQLGEAAARPLPRVLRGALAALADGLLASGMPLPGIHGVHLSAAAVEILLMEAAPQPPGPYRVKPGTQDMCWVLDAGDWDRLPAGGGTGRGDLLPGLFTAGITPEAGYVLTDLEDAGVMTVDGQDGLIDRVVTGAAVELATNPWAGVFDLLLVGFPELDGVGGRAQACPGLDAALALLADRAGQLAAAPPGAAVRDRRLADPGCPDWTLTLLVSRIVPEPAQMAQLLDLALPGSGIAALVAGDVRDPSGREAPASLDLHEEAAQPGMIHVSMHPLGILLTSEALSAGSHEAVREIFQAAAAADVGPADPPYNSTGVADWPPDGHDSAGGPAESADPGSGIPDPVRTAPAGGPDIAQMPAAPGAGQLRLNILGPFEITGSASDLQPKHAELVLALALAGHPGLPGSALRMMLGSSEDTPKSPDSLRQIITRTRRELGKTPGGREYILHAGNSKYVLDQSGWLDWHAFHALAETGRAAHDRDALRDALALVRGRPLDGVYHWWVETALIETIRAEITDTADLLAELELAAGDPAAARRAARTGLAADPAAEPLWRAVMRAEHAGGNTPGVHHAWRECLAAIEDIAVDGEPHEDTAALYSQLTRRHPVAAGAR